MIVAGTVLVFQDSLKSFNNVLLVSSPKFFIMSFMTPLGPGPFLHFNCLIASSTLPYWLLQSYNCLLAAGPVSALVALWPVWFFLLIVLHYFPLDSALPSSWLLSFGWVALLLILGQFFGSLDCLHSAIWWPSTTYMCLFQSLMRKFSHAMQP